MPDYAWKNIVHRWVRSLLTVMGVAVMMTLIIVTTGIVNYQKRIMNAHAAAAGGKVYAQSRLAGLEFPAATIDLPEATADALLARPDLQTTLSGKSLFLPIAPPRYPNEPPQVLLVGIERGKEEAFTGSVAQDVKPTSGVEFFAQSQAAAPVILGRQAHEYYALELGRALQVGDSLTILDGSFTVVGILGDSANQAVNNALIVPLELAQAMLDKTGFVSAAILTVERLDEKTRLMNEIQQAYPRLNLVSDERIRNNAEAGLKQFENIITAVAVVVTIGAALLIMTVMTITVKERTREIGILRALGASAGLITLSVCWEILGLSGLGSALGALAASLILRLGLATNLFSLTHVLSYMPLALVLTLLAGLLPAWQISRVLPVESLCYE